MKKWITVSIGAVFILTLCFIIHAQETVQGGEVSLTDTNVDWNSMSDLEVELKAIESVPPMPSDSLPTAGTFWSAQHAPGSAEEWPPLPIPLDMSAWSLGGDGVYLLDDLNHVYPVPKISKSATTTSSGTMMTMDNVDLNPNDGGSTNGGSGGSFSPMFSPGGEFGTNLWVEITNLTDSTAGFMVSNTIADVEYEVQSTTNLADSQWNSEGFFFGSEITNWTPTSAEVTTYPNLFFRIRSWIDSDNVGIPDWWQLKYFGYVGINPYTTSPAGDGFNIFSKYQGGISPTTFVTPPAPNNFVAVLSTNGTNVLLSWNAAQGSVANYTLLQGVYDFNTGSYDFSTIGTVNSSTTSFNAVDAIQTDDDLYDDFEVEAQYGGGNSSQVADSYVYYSTPPPPTPPTPIYNISASATLIRNATGRWQLMFSDLSANAQAVNVIWTDVNGNTSTQNISASILTNGIYQIPDATVATYLGDSVSVQGVETNGESGAVVAAGVLPADAPYFVDGRRHMKQNLIFLIRAASIYGTFGSTANGNMLVPVPYNFNYYAERLNSSTNFEEFSFLSGNRDYENLFFWSALDNLWPFTANFDLSNFIMDTSRTNYFFGSTNFNFTVNFATNIPVQPILNPTDPFWIVQPGLDFNLDPTVLTNNGSNWGLTFSDTNTIVNLQSGIKNLFGLSYGGGYALADNPYIHNNQDFSYPLIYQSLNPGDIITAQYITNGYEFVAYASQCPTPVLLPINYYFAPLINPNLNPANLPPVNQQPIPLPIDDAFNVTNQTPPVIIGAVGQPMIIGAWAKYSISNSSPTKYAYLGQYFATNAFLLNTNGNATTNIAGIVSPYGEFFPTQAGQAQLITMPDIDTGKQGTNIVQIISLNVDANHDGTMDLSYFGQDQTSPSKPYVFWCNNNFDRGHTVDLTDFEQDDLQSDSCPYTPSTPTPDCNYMDIGGNRIIPDTRDLEDFPRLWISGVTSNLLASLPSGSTVTLSWGDVGSPNPANPTIDLFQAADIGGGIGYLTNSTIAANQINPAQSAYVGRISPGQGVQLNANFFGSTWRGNYFIWCGVTNGSGKLTLSFADASGKALGQASVYIQIQDIKQMYERWTVGDNPNNAPAGTPQIAQDGLVSGETPFQYGPATTNTPYILFVHGWNIATWEKDRFAETAFKRLYWQGYQGRFGEFRWPTSFNFPAESFQYQSIDLDNYDNSEFNAWQSGAGLLNLLTNLNAQYPNSVYLMAHSMGNVVAGEALKQAGTSQVVNTYIAMQGAVPAHCYDANATTRSLGLYDSGTPNRYANYYTNGAPCYFNGSAGARTYVNFFNTNDYALNSDHWQLDQNTKPDLDYGYNTTDGFYRGILTTTPLYFPINTYEIFAYCDEARCFALGAQPNVGGAFKTLTYHQVELDISPYGFGYAHKYHSGEFRSDNIQRWQFWDEVLFQMGLKTNL